MSKVSVFTKFSCVEDKEEEAAEVLATLVEASKSAEGVEVYSYHRADDGTYWFFALMSSKEAADSHAENPEIQAAMPKMMEVLDGMPEVYMAEPLAANGLSI